MKKILLILFIIPLLSNCTQYTALVGPSLTFAQTGSILQTSTSLTSSLMMNKASIAAALNCKKIGCNPPSKVDIESFKKIKFN